jgi:hypothetical protein
MFKSCIACEKGFVTQSESRILCDGCGARHCEIQRQLDRLEAKSQPKAKPKSPSDQSLKPGYKPYRRPSPKRASKKSRAICDRLLKTLKLAIGCQCCGYDKHASVLAFHHTAHKAGPIRTERFVSDDGILDELATCCIVCHNCHTEIHREGRPCPPPIGIEAASEFVGVASRVLKSETPPLAAHAP